MTTFEICLIRIKFRTWTERVTSRAQSLKVEKFRDKPKLINETIWTAWMESEYSIKTLLRQKIEKEREARRTIYNILIKTWMDWFWQVKSRVIEI